MFFFDMEIRSDFFISRYSFIVGRVKESLKTNIIGSSLFGRKHFRLRKYYTNDIKILIALICERNVYSCWQSFVDFLEIAQQLLFSICCWD